MKCPNCGAESTGRFCSFCGSEMPQQPVTIINNYYGDNITNNQMGRQTAGGVRCPECGSTSIAFQRETTATRGVHKTVGICRNCGNTWVTAQDSVYAYNTVPVQPKSKIAALIMCIFFGYFGVHQFYVGKVGMGILYIFTIGLFGIGWIIDIFLIAFGAFKDKNGIPVA